MRLFPLIIMLTACAPEAAPPPSAEISAMSVEGDFDGDGAADRAELWIQHDASRLLIYRAANPAEPIMAHQSQGVASFLRIRSPDDLSPDMLSRASIQFDALSYGSGANEVLVYWDGGVFRALELGG